MRSLLSNSSIGTQFSLWMAETFWYRNICSPDWFAWQVCASMKPTWAWPQIYFTYRQWTLRDLSKLCSSIRILCPFPASARAFDVASTYLRCVINLYISCVLCAFSYFLLASLLVTRSQDCRSLLSCRTVFLPRPFPDVIFIILRLHVQSQVLTNQVNESIVETLFQNPDKMHLTLGCLSLVDDVSKRIAMDTLKNCKETVIK